MLGTSNVLIIAAIAVALVIFNLSRSQLQHELQVSFDSWYKQVAPSLQTTAEGAPLGQSITITITSVGLGETPSLREWKLPTGTLPNREECNRLDRVLQLLAEAQVFSLPALVSPSNRQPYVSISVVEADRKFETIVSLQEVQDNIQLQNLLKLLDIFASTPATGIANPAQT